MYLIHIANFNWFETFQVYLLYGTSTYGYKDVCTHTLSICGIYSKPFTVWAAHLPRPACQPVTQSAKNLPNLPTAQDCPGPYRPKLLHRDSGFNSLGANTGTHILLSWHSSRMPHSITNFAWSILQPSVKFINHLNKHHKYFYRGFSPYATFGTWKKFALAKFLFYVRSNKINSL